MTLINAGGAARAETDGDLSAPSLAEFHQMLVRGELRMGAPENMYLYGKVYLNEFLANLSKPEFEVALAIAG